MTGRQSYFLGNDLERQEEEPIPRQRSEKRGQSLGQEHEKLEASPSQVHKKIMTTKKERVTQKTKGELEETVPKMEDLKEGINRQIQTNGKLEDAVITPEMEKKSYLSRSQNTFGDKEEELIERMIKLLGEMLNIDKQKMKN